MNKETVKAIDITSELVATGVEEDAAKALLAAYGMPLNEAGAILSTYKDIKVKDESQAYLMAEARQKRLKLRDIRIAVGKRHDELKADILKQGNAIDFVARTVRQYIEPAEVYLENQEKFAERAATMRKAELIIKRTTELLKYTDDTSMYNFENMADDAFEMLLKQLKAQRAQEELDRMEREQVAQAEAERAEKERAATLKAAETARKAAEKLARAEALKRRAAEKVADIERARREELEEAELKRADAERIEFQQKEIARLELLDTQKKAAAAPDKEKLNAYVMAMATVAAPELSSDPGNAVLARIEKHLNTSLDAYTQIIEEEL